MVLEGSPTTWAQGSVRTAGQTWASSRPTPAITKAMDMAICATTLQCGVLEGLLDTTTGACALNRLGLALTRTRSTTQKGFAKTATLQATTETASSDSKCTRRLSQRLPQSRRLPDLTKKACEMDPKNSSLVCPLTKVSQLSNRARYRPRMINALVRSDRPDSKLC